MKMMKHCEKLHNGTNDERVRQYMLSQIQQGQEMYKQLVAGQTPATETEQPEITSEPINTELPPLPADAPAAEAETTTVAETPEVTAEPQPEPAKQTTKKKNNRRK